MYECITGEKPPEVLERLHAGLGQPLADGRWPGYSKRFLSSVDAAMIVKPDERPQSISDWLPMFGRDIEDDSDDGDEATRFYAKQVHTEDIKPVAPTPNVEPRPVETGVPADPREAKFKRVGEETGTSRKMASEPRAPEEAKSVPAAARAADAPAKPSEAGTTAAKLPKDAAGAGRKKPSTVLIAGGAVALVAVAGLAAISLRSGETAPEITASKPAPSQAPETRSTVAALGPAGGAPATNGAAAGATNVATGMEPPAPPKAPQASDQTNTLEALRSEKAKTAAAEAELAALKKAAARSSTSASTPGAPPQPSRKADRKAASTAQVAPSATASTGVSSAKLAQFNATVDEARSMAKQAMHSSNRQNVDMAKNYDKYLKTLKDSMRGIDSDKEADKLIKQANQTKAYIQFLLRQN
jgi:hypothetical protein